MSFPNLLSYRTQLSLLSIALIWLNTFTPAVIAASIPSTGGLSRLTHGSQASNTSLDLPSSSSNTTTNNVRPPLIDLVYWAQQSDIDFHIHHPDSPIIGLGSIRAATLEQTLKRISTYLVARDGATGAYMGWTGHADFERPARPGIFPWMWVRDSRPVVPGDTRLFDPQKLPFDVNVAFNRIVHEARDGKAEGLTFVSVEPAWNYRTESWYEGYDPTEILYMLDWDEYKYAIGTATGRIAYVDQPSAKGAENGTVNGTVDAVGEAFGTE